MKNTDIKIDGIPDRSLYDEPLNIGIHDLPAKKKVKLTLEGDLRSFGHSEVIYRTDKDGTIELTKQKPIEGDFDGVEPMGLFKYRSKKESTHIDENEPKETPDSEKFKLTIEIDDKKVSVKEFKRIIRSKDVERIKVEEDGIEGVFFKPSGDPPYPAVIALGGSEGMCPTGIQTRLLASRGYAVLALAIYGEGSLPDELMKVPLEYFEKAVSWLKSRDCTVDEPLGVMGGSKGGELALLLGSRIEDIRTVIAYSPSGVMFQGIPQSFEKPTSSWLYDDEPTPFVELAFLPSITSYLKYIFLRKPIEWRDTYSKGFKRSSEKEIEEASIQVENIGGPVLLITGEDDRMWDANRLSKIAVNRLEMNDYRYPYKHLNFKGVGHAIRAPYTPVTGRDLIHDGKWKLGGKPDGFSEADQKSWNYVLKYLDKGLKSRSKNGD